LYKIQQDKVIPFLKWNINPDFQLPKDETILNTNGLTGEYLFINYRRNDHFYIYLENMKTGRIYNVSNLVDNVFHTDGNCKLFPLNQEGCFFFIKDTYDIKGNNTGNMSLKEGPDIFIVKTK